MTIQTTNPPTLPVPQGFSQAVTTTGIRTVYVSGQVAVTRDGTVVGGDDVVAQARQAYANLRDAVEAAGARMSDVAKITTYVVNFRAERFPDLLAVRREAFGNHAPASTLVGVASLAQPQYLFEIEAIAVID